MMHERIDRWPRTRVDRWMDGHEHGFDHEDDYGYGCDDASYWLLVECRRTLYLMTRRFV